MAWPASPLTITSLGEGSSLNANAIANVTLLGGGEALSWRQDGKGLHLELPAEPVGNHAFVIKIVLKG